MAKAKPSTSAPIAVTALTAIIYDDVRFEAGDAIELREGDLQQLLDVAAVQLATPAA